MKLEYYAYVNDKKLKTQSELCAERFITALERGADLKIIQAQNGKCYLFVGGVNLDLIDRAEFDSLTVCTTDKNTVIIGDNRYNRTHVISQLREGVSLTTYTFLSKTDV